MQFHTIQNLSECTECQSILRSQPARFVQYLVTLLLLLLGTALLFAALAEADLVVLSQGRIRPTSDPICVYSSERFSPDISGRITEVGVSMGDAVNTGDVIVRLDDSRLINQQTRLERTLESVTQELLKIESLGQLLIDEHQTALEKARSQISQARNEVELAEKHRAVAVAKAELELERANSHLNRVTELRRANAASDRDIQEAENNQKAANEDLEMARLPVDRSQIAVLESSLTLLERQHKVRREEWSIRRESKLAAATTARLDLEKVQVELKHTVIRSSVDGIVTSEPPKVGDVVEPGQPLIEIASDDGFRFQAVVSNEDVGLLEHGMDVRIKLDAFDYQKYGSLIGSVESVSPDSHVQEANGIGQPAYFVEINVDRTQLQRGEHTATIKLGMTGRAEIVTDQESLLTLLLRKIRRTISFG